MHHLVEAPAKVNLALDIVGRRPDGYHEVQMIMTTLALADTLTITPAGQGIEVVADAPDLPGIPDGPENLVYRAATLLHRVADKPVGGVHIRIHKRIPGAAGLGGGSADAAAALRMLSNLWGLSLPAGQLMDLALQLGADVPFCLQGGTQLAEGIGERLRPVPAVAVVPAVVATPDVTWSGPKTATVYRAYHGTTVIERPDIRSMIAALADRNVTLVARNMGNVLEPAAMGIHPIIGEVKTAMLAAGAMGAVMAGAGPSVFALCATDAVARKVAAAARQFTSWVFETRTLGHAGT